MKGTDFVVGDEVSYEVNKDKGKIKSKSGKEVGCTVVRVENMSSAQTEEKPR
jgi:hypothetical protein